MSRPDGDGVLWGPSCNCGSPFGWHRHGSASGTSWAASVTVPAPATAPQSPVAEMVRLSAEAGLYGDMGAATAAEADLRDALRAHHPIMRSETGPFSGCRCGQVKLGQDVIAHVMTQILALPALQRLVEQAAEATRLRAVVERVEALVVSGEQTEAETAAEGDPVTVYVYVRQLRRALGGTDG